MEQDVRHGMAWIEVAGAIDFVSRVIFCLFEVAVNEFDEDRPN